MKINNISTVMLWKWTLPVICLTLQLYKCYLCHTIVILSTCILTFLSQIALISTVFKLLFSLFFMLGFKKTNKQTKILYTLSPKSNWYYSRTSITFTAIDQCKVSCKKYTTKNFCLICSTSQEESVLNQTTTRSYIRGMFL